MAEIVVLLKPALNPGMIKADVQGTLLVDSIPLKLSDIDRNAVQVASDIKSTIGADKIIGIAVLTWGPVAKRMKDAESSLREALAMGVDEAHILADDKLIPGDPTTTATTLKALLDKLGINPKLILAGEATVDGFTGQVPGRLAALLGLPYISFAKKIEISGDKITAERDLEDFMEKVEANLPAVVSVTREINTPRLPTLIQIRRAFKKPLTKYTLGDLGLDISSISSILEARVLAVQRKQTIIEGDNPEEIADKLLEALVNEGAIKL
ncbi:MAG: electron transfer flavoprotein subunit beta/FixA family protein [Desulfurococcales archaeon]|nr:electron transfer flavoprotein subunit beta/FixA family protein [Desulfurococcales archaeon]